MSEDVFILGAGFSKAISEHMPTLAELSEIIRQRMDELFLEKEKPPEEMTKNIEILLSYLAQNHPWLTKAQQLRNKAAFLELSKIIGDELKKKQENSNQQNLPEWFSKLVHSWQDKQTDVITFNYDTLIEKEAVTIEARIIDSEHSSQIYLDDLWPVTISPAFLRMGGGYTDTGHHTFHLFKMHGSIDWYYSGSAKYYGEPIYTINHRHSNPDEMRAAIRDKTPLIIPPTLDKTAFFNNETVQNIWGFAGQALRGARRIFCLGYSFPVSDMMARFFILTNQSYGNVEFYWVNIAEHQGDLKDMLPLSYRINTQYRRDDAISVFTEDYINGDLA